VRKLGVSFDQILLEVHTKGVDKTNFKFKPRHSLYSGAHIDNLFITLVGEGYAIFHKEVNVLPQKTSEGGYVTAVEVCEYGLVLTHFECSY
jgi:hypothetical protein